MSYSENDTDSSLYIKVDIAKGKPKDGYWNNDDDSRWKTDDSLSHEEAGYSTYDISELEKNSDVRIKPSIGSTNGGKYFHITENETNYIFSTVNERYVQKYIDFDEFSGRVKNAPSLEQLLENDSDESSKTSIINFVKYNKQGQKHVDFTDKMKSYVKPGDVIYFYTDKEKFDVDHQIEYMVVITEQLVGATVSELIASSIEKPMNYKYTENENIHDSEYVVSNINTVSVLYNSDIDESKLKTFGKSFSNFVIRRSESPVALGSYTTEDYQKILELSYNTKNDIDKNTNLTFGTKSDENGKQIELKASDDSQMIPLKMNDLYIKNDNNGNVEIMDYMNSGNYLYFDYEGYIHHCFSKDNFNDIDKFTIHRNLFLYDTETVSDSLMCGFIKVKFCQRDVTDNFNLSSENWKFNVDFSDEKCEYSEEYLFDESMDINLEKEQFDYIETDRRGHQYEKTGWCSYMLRTFAYDKNGTRHYSRETFAVYNETEEKFIIFTPGIETADDMDDVKDDSIKFSFSGLSVDETDMNQIPKLLVKIPAGADDYKIFINSQRISDLMSYRNSWINISSYKESLVEETLEGGTIPFLYKQFSMDVIASSNLPDVYQTDAKTIAEYNASPGETNIVDGCSLFNAIINNENLTTKSRNLNVTVVYMNNGKEYRSHYKIEQPGYIEKRNIPEVDIKINKELRALESANRQSNGVLCNEYQFYVDIAVNNFDRNNWGSYVDEDNVTLNFDITNATIDDEFIEQYSIQYTEDTYTVHVNTPDLKKDTENNYISIKTFLVDDTIEDVYSASQKELDLNNDEIIASKKISVFETVQTSDPTMSEQIYDVPVGDSQERTKRCVLTSSIMFEDPNVRRTGLNNNTIVSFRNLKYSDVKNRRYKMRVLVEYGNPLFSRLFFRYYVSNMWIEYKNNDGSISKFYVGTEKLNKKESVGTYTDTDYMFSTDTFNVFVCPVSLTAIPEDKSLTEIKGNVKLTGSPKQIELSMDTYTGFIDYSKTTDELMKEYLEQQSIPWEQFKLKKRYLQDNIKHIDIDSVYIQDMIDRISSYELFGISTENNYSYQDIRSEMNTNNYLSVVYHSGLYNPNMRDDKMSFIYNEEVLEASRYNQFLNESPVYTPTYMSYEVRDDELVSSMEIWNDEYSAAKLKDENIFMGNLSATGNGYTRLDSSFDTGQYPDNMTLSDTLLNNEEWFFNGSYVDNAPQLSQSSVNHPDKGYWFRTLLYNTKWCYPQYYIDTETQQQKINAFDIVSSGEYLKGIKDGSYLNKLPYNLMFSVYPRCAYNDEDDVAIVFMLRCPSIVKENQYRMEHKDLLLPVEESAYNSYQVGNE